MANLEALKAKFECSEADSRMRLEARLDEANIECSNLRRRLQVQLQLLLLILNLYSNISFVRHFEEFCLV